MDIVKPLKTLLLCAIVQMCPGTAFSQSYTQQDVLDQAVWFRPKIQPTVITDNCDAVYSNERINMEDGRVIHANALHGWVAPNNLKVAMPITHPGHTSSPREYSIRVVSSGDPIASYGYSEEAHGRFGPDSSFYHVQAYTIFKEGVVWSPLPSQNAAYAIASFDNTARSIRILSQRNNVTELLIYDLDTKLLKQTIALGARTIGGFWRNVVFGDGICAILEPNARMSIYDQATGFKYYEFEIPSNLTNAGIEFSPDDKRLIFFSYLDPVAVWDINQRALIDVPWITNAESLVFSPNGRRALLKRTENTPTDGRAYLEIRDAESGGLIRSTEGMTAQLDAVPTTPIAIMLNGIFDAESGKIIDCRGASSVGAHGILSPDGVYAIHQFVVDGKYAAEVRLVKDFSPVFLLPKEVGEPHAWLKEPNLLLCISRPTSGKSIVSVVNVKTGLIVRKIAFDVSLFNATESLSTFLQDSNEIAYIDWASGVLIFVDVTTGLVSRQFGVANGDQHRSIVCSQDGKYICIGTYKNLYMDVEYNLYKASDLTKFKTIILDSRASVSSISLDGRYVTGGVNTGSSYDSFLFDTVLGRNVYWDPVTPIGCFVGHQAVNNGECVLAAQSFFALMRMNNSFGGVVNVPGRAGSKAEMPAQVNVYDSTGSLKKSRQTMLGNYGRFTAGLPLADGNYSLWLKPKGCLAAKASFVMPVGLKDWLPVSCIPGDCNGDNKVDATDVDALSNAFDTSEGDEGFSADCELTGDHYVGTDDYLLIGANLGKVGAALP